MTWTTPGTVLTPSDTLSPEHQACVDDVLDAAMEWHTNPTAMPWHIAANVGGIERRTIAGTWHRSPGYTRWTAIRHTPRDDPRWAALDALCGEIVRMTGHIETRFGVFEPNELSQHDAAVRFVRSQEPAPWERRTA